MDWDLNSSCDTNVSTVIFSLGFAAESHCKYQTFAQPHHHFALAPPASMDAPLPSKRKAFATSNPPSPAQDNMDCDMTPVPSSPAVDGIPKRRRMETSQLLCLQNLRISPIHADATQIQPSEDKSELVQEVEKGIKQLRSEFTLWTDEAESEVSLFRMIAENPQNATLDSFAPSFEALRSILESANVENPGNVRIVDRNGFNTNQQLHFLLAPQPLDMDAPWGRNAR